MLRRLPIRAHDLLQQSYVSERSRNTLSPIDRSPIAPQPPSPKRTIFTLCRLFPLLSPLLDFFQGLDLDLDPKGPPSSPQDCPTTRGRSRTSLIPSHLPGKARSPRRARRSRIRSRYTPSQAVKAVPVGAQHTRGTTVDAGHRLYRSKASNRNKKGSSTDFALIPSARVQELV